jgi:hypothetical protein
MFPSASSPSSLMGEENRRHCFFVEVILHFRFFQIFFALADKNFALASIANTTPQGDSTIEVESCCTYIT